VTQWSWKLDLCLLGLKGNVADTTVSNIYGMDLPIQIAMVAFPGWSLISGHLYSVSK